jgi:ferredoxin
MTRRLRVDPIACGKRLCAEILPELITLDDWGFPVIPGECQVPSWPTPGWRSGSAARPQAGGAALGTSAGARVSGGRVGSCPGVDLRHVAGAGQQLEPGLEDRGRGYAVLEVDDQIAVPQITSVSTATS